MSLGRFRPGVPKSLWGGLIETSGGLLQSKMQKFCICLFHLEFET